jgi:hypothetical protein
MPRAVGAGGLVAGAAVVIPPTPEMLMRKPTITATATELNRLKSVPSAKG